MNASKHLIACAALLIALFSATSTFAQGGGRMMDTAAMRQRLEARVQKAKDDLKLTQVQADSLKAIQMDQSAKTRDIFTSDPGASREDRMAKMQPIRDAANKRIEAVLGADLYKKYQDWEAANRPQRGGGN